MTSSRKLRTELGEYLGPYGMSVAPGPQRTVKLFDGDVEFGTVNLTNLYDMVGATKSAHARNPAVPVLKPARPPKATTSHKVPTPAAPRSVAELEALFEDAPAPRPTTQAPPWDAIAAAATAAAQRVQGDEREQAQADALAAVRRRRVPGAGLVPERLCGCAVIARVRTPGELEGEVLPPLVDAADNGLRRGLPTWLVRDVDGRLAVLVTNGEPVAA